MSVITEDVVEVTPIKGVNYDPMPGGGSRAKAGNKVWRCRTYLDGREHTIGRYETISEANEAMEAFYQRREDQQRECSLTGLKVGSCYHCQGVDLPGVRPRVSPGPATPSSRRGRAGRPREVIIAHRDFKFPCIDCGVRFVRDDRMRASVSNLLVHEVCPPEGD